jgi:hypothetical protein
MAAYLEERRLDEEGGILQRQDHAGLC